MNCVPALLKKKRISIFLPGPDVSNKTPFTPGNKAQNGRQMLWYTADNNSSVGTVMKTVTSMHPYPIMSLFRMLGNTRGPTVKPSSVSKPVVLKILAGVRFMALQHWYVFGRMNYKPNAMSFGLNAVISSMVVSTEA